MKQFIIHTEKGFYKDFINGLFTDHIAGAHVFDTYIEAAQLKKALEVMDGIKKAVILDGVLGNPVDEMDLLNLALQVVKEAEANAAANPTSDEILVVIIEPGKKPYKKVIPNSLDSFQEIVGGHIENVFVGRSAKDARIAITLNEEGKLIPLPFNRRIIKNGRMDDFMGSFFVTAYNMQGDNVSLSDQEADHFIQRFRTTEVYL